MVFVLMTAINIYYSSIPDHDKRPEQNLYALGLVGFDILALAFDQVHRYSLR